MSLDISLVSFIEKHKLNKEKHKQNRMHQGDIPQHDEVYGLFALWKISDRIKKR